MKVYVLTEGCYSGYHIIGVTLDEEQAKIAADALSNEHFIVNCEEFETNDINVIKSGWNLWKIYFDKKTHAITRIYQSKYPDCLGAVRLTCDEILEIVDYSCADGALLQYISDAICVEVYAEDKEHAVKSASDKLSKYLAEQAGI